MNKELKIWVLPKVEFKSIMDNNNINEENVDEFVKYAFICINDSTGNFYHKPIFNDGHHNVLNLEFDDVITECEYKEFTKEHAKQVIEFINNNKTVNSFMIHCAAGISRSGAIGQFILDYFSGDKDFFKKTNRHILPNGKVLRLLNEEVNRYGR